MSGDLTALAAAWQKLPASTTNDKLVMLNATTVPGPARDTPRSEIIKVLQSGGAFDAMKQYVANPPSGAVAAALQAANYLLAIVGYEKSISDTLPTSDPANLALVQQISPNLLLDARTGVTQSTIDQMMALITPPVPWWRAHGFSGPITVRNLIDAGNLF